MSNSNLTGHIAITVLGVAVAVGVSFMLNARYTDAYVATQLVEKLPGQVDKTLELRESKVMAAQRDRILAGWTAAKNADMKDGRHVYGNPQAEFTLVEFSDLECPFCQRFHDTPKRIADGSNGQINWEWQHYPLQFHDPAANAAAVAAECIGEQVGNQAFWAFTGEYFSHTQLNGQGPEDLEKIALSVGAQPDPLRSCMSSGKYDEKIQKQISRGTALGVTGTPATVVVDNTTGKHLIVKGAQPAQSFRAAIAQLVAMRNEAPDQEGLPAPEQSPATVPAPIKPLDLGGGHEQ